MLSVSAYNVVSFGIAGVDEGAVKDVSDGIDTGTFHRFVDGLSKVTRKRYGVGFSARSHRELVGWDVFHLLFAETVCQGEFDEVWFDVDLFVLPAVLGDLLELVIGNKHSQWRAFGRMFKTHGHKAIQVSAGQSDPTV